MFDVNEDGLKHHRLPNGMRIYLRDQPATRLVHIGMFVHHGSQNEDVQTNGLAHVIEHVLFTPRYFSGSAAALFGRLEQQGASYEAFTSKEYTRVFLKCLPESFGDALAFMSHLAQTRELDPSAVEEERPIILHEHAMNFSSSLSMEKQVLDNAMWGDQSIGLFLLGRKENIQRFTTAEIEARIRSYFAPERALLLIGGPFDAPAAAEEVTRRFADWRGGDQPVPEPVAVPMAKAIALPTQSKRVALQLGYLAFPFGSPERCEAELLADILGGGIRSRLFRELRENKKLVYHVQAIPVSYEIGGHLAIAINCDRHDVGACCAAIKGVLASLQEVGTTTAELERAKAERIMGLLDAAESQREYMHLVGRQALLSGPSSPPFGIVSEITRVNEVDPDEILQQARRMFVDDGLGAVGFGLEEKEMSALFD